jgi:proteasome lid subunit RPN8/RPN11
VKLLVPHDVAERLVTALREAHRREIGGILMGEHVSTNTFRVSDITIQTKGGTFAAFVRLVEELIAPLRDFFHRTRRDFTRFNYLGEWHSHHSFRLEPSDCDRTTMVDMATDSDLGARFVTLLLVRLGVSNSLETAVTVYTSDGSVRVGEVVLET